MNLHSSIRRRRLAVHALAVAFGLGLIVAEGATAEVVNVDLTAKRQLVKIAPGVKMKAWTFNGTVPGPVIRAREGDTIAVSVHNADKRMAHSVDFHAARDLAADRVRGRAPR